MLEKKVVPLQRKTEMGVALPNSIMASTPVFGTEDPGSIPG